MIGNDTFRCAPLQLRAVTVGEDSGPRKINRYEISKPHQMGRHRPGAESMPSKTSNSDNARQKDQHLDTSQVKRRTTNSATIGSSGLFRGVNPWNVFVTLIRRSEASK